MRHWTLQSNRERRMTNRILETESPLNAKGRAMRDHIVQSTADLAFTSDAHDTTLDVVS
jgi:hypothetical protein